MWSFTVYIRDTSIYEGDSDNVIRDYVLRCKSSGFAAEEIIVRHEPFSLGQEFEEHERTAHAMDRKPPSIKELLARLIKDGRIFHKTEVENHSAAVQFMDKIRGIITEVYGQQ